MAFSWTCPYCSIVQTVTDTQHRSTISSLAIDNQAEGKIAVRTHAIGCSNLDCLKTEVSVTVGQYHTVNGLMRITSDGKKYFNARILPQGAAIPQPDYIPQPLRDDYSEACLIRDLSPKASATLIRRCLQGMIRDFAKITKGTLNEEINTLRAAVDNGTADRAITPETVDAIDHIRKVGNIGAHMEKDISQIVDVDPGEAQALIEIVEMLFQEWYVARETRKMRLAKIASISLNKDQQKVAFKQST